MKPALLCALLTFVAPSSAVEKEHWRNVRGAALKTLFQGKEFADGVHFAYQFKADGTFTGTEMSKAVGGSWRVRKSEFCWTWLQPPGPHETGAPKAGTDRSSSCSNDRRLGNSGWFISDLKILVAGDRPVARGVGLSRSSRRAPRAPAAGFP